MVERVKKVKEVFRLLGYEPDFKRFEDRQKAQNIVYLLQLKKMDFGYKFNTKHIKPFSVELMRELEEEVKR